LNNRNLYRDRSRVRREATQSTRRVVRLVLALGVVLVVMRQAADPSIYRPFFPGAAEAPVPAVAPSSLPASESRASGSRASGSRASGSRASGSARNAAARPGEPVAPAADATSSSSVNGPARSADDLWQATDQERDAIALLDEAARKRLTERLGAWRRSTAEPNTDEVTEQTPAEFLASLYEEFPELVVLGEPSGEMIAVATAPQGTLRRFQGALDATYQQAVTDGAIWHAGDAEAFYRYLEMAAAPDFSDQFLASDPSPRHVGVVPLMQQPDEYLGQTVWLYGTVARSVPVAAKANAFGVRDYWEVWLRPDDGSDRAVVLYAPDVPDDVAAVGPEGTQPTGPKVTLAGRFLKRRLFGAVGGAMESPVIVGRVWERPPAVATIPSRDAGRPVPLSLLVAVAAIIGVAVSALLVWRNSVAAKQLRATRRDSQSFPVAQLDELVGVRDPHDSASHDSASREPT